MLLSVVPMLVHLTLAQAGEQPACPPPGAWSAILQQCVGGAQPPPIVQEEPKQTAELATTSPQPAHFLLAPTWVSWGVVGFTLTREVPLLSFGELPMWLGLSGSASIIGRPGAPLLLMVPLTASVVGGWAVVSELLELLATAGLGGMMTIGTISDGLGTIAVPSGAWVGRAGVGARIKATAWSTWVQIDANLLFGGQPIAFALSLGVVL